MPVPGVYSVQCTAQALLGGDREEGITSLAIKGRMTQVEKRKRMSPDGPTAEERWLVNALGDRLSGLCVFLEVAAQDGLWVIPGLTLWGQST